MTIEPKKELTDEEKAEQLKLGRALLHAVVDEVNFAPHPNQRTWQPAGAKKPIPQNEADPKTGRRLLLD